MSDTREPKTVDVSALIAGDVQFVQVDVWTEGKGLHHVKLRVVEEVGVVSTGVHSFCDACGACLDPHPDFEHRPKLPLCPGCGNKIKRA